MNNLTFQIYFRFRYLNKLQVLTLARELEGVSYTENIASAQSTATTTQQSFIALVALTAANLDAINIFYVRQGFDVSCCDILVQTKLAQTTGFTLPVIVNQMLKHIDCPVSFALES